MMITRRKVLWGFATLPLVMVTRPLFADGLLDGLTDGLGDNVGDLGGLADSAGGLGAGLPTSEVTAGLKEALRFASERAVGDISVFDGFNADPDIHIPLPESLGTVQSALQTIGMSDMADELETKINRAAETASGEATDIFWGAVDNMSIEDAEGILNGPDDAATQYFRRETSTELKGAMRPIVDESLADVGAIQAYDSMMGEYDNIPFMPDVKSDITEYALDGTLDGLFVYVAREEAAIRNDPVARTTELLQSVFG